MARSPLKVAGAIALGAGLVAIGGIAGLGFAGRRIRETAHPDTDALLPPPDDVTHRTVTSADGAEIHLAERGEGRPLLLLHGVTLQWWVWGAQFNTLSDRYRVIAWDMRGHGRSTVGRDGITLEAVADDVAAVLEQLDLRDAVVVGHSMGGMALGRFCARHEDLMVERCGGLMFLDTNAATLVLPALLEGSTRAQEIVRRAAYAGTSRPRVRYAWPDTNASLLMVRTAFGREPSAKAVEDVRGMLAEMDHDHLVAAGRAIVDHDVRKDLRHVKVPAMVVVGSADLLTPVSQAKVLASAMPGSVMHVLPGVGHQTMQEAPARFAELVDELAAMSD
ncbi:alpha/beta fold hydrolase [Dermatobacter hominis]|uniref:alpha/beta fold hydrolase n=1 Tax=Dermatobacter hominis TaxID=2884263 RepID=UPI001D10A367|nr:alpha/beta hydrolase [Dermatobacter hominis]UDY36856.1 alpha/beta hydrolase [Dermatobacter hominis]